MAPPLKWIIKLCENENVVVFFDNYELCCKVCPKIIIAMMILGQTSDNALSEGNDTGLD